MPQPTSGKPRPSRQDTRRARTREAIIEAAARVFREKGVDEATVTDVTNEADVAYGSFYNHFKAMDEVVSAVAERAIKRVADTVGTLLDETHKEVELLPCIGARVVMRMLTQDTAIRWLLGRPLIFVEEFYRHARPFMLAAERRAVATGRLKPAGGHECWLRTYPWMLISELSAALESGDVLAHEERFAVMSLRFLGIDDELAPKLLHRSNELVTANGLGEVRPRAKRSNRETRRSRSSSI